MTRKLKMGMVGGGKDAFIGTVHRFAANLDGRIELLGGAFSSNPKKSHESGSLLMLDPNRVYNKLRGCSLLEEETYPDMESDFETFTNADFLELETFGPLKKISGLLRCPSPGPGGADEGVEALSRAALLSLASSGMVRADFVMPLAIVGGSLGRWEKEREGSCRG